MGVFPFICHGESRRVLFIENKLIASVWLTAKRKRLSEM